MKNLMNNPLNKAFYLSLFFVLSLVVVSCKTKKVAMETREKKDLLALVSANSLEYNTFSGKMKTLLRMGKSEIGVSSSLKMIKNEKLQLSIQAPILGEMFRMSLSNDSLVIVDRMNKAYVAESMNLIRQTASFEFDLVNLQSLFTNQIFIAGKSDVTVGDYTSFVVDQNQYDALIKAKDKNNINYIFVVDHTWHIKNTMIQGNSGNNAINWSYDKFSSLENKAQFPMQMDIQLGDKKNKMGVIFQFTKIELDKNVEIDFSIPKKYNRITLEQAITLLNKLQ